MKKRVCVITAGHLSTCPRMLKAADALEEAGYDVRVISTRFIQWATDADNEVRRNRSWKWSVVNYDRNTAFFTYLKSGLRQRMNRVISGKLSPSRRPLGLVAAAYSRVHNEILARAIEEPADFFYGGTTNGLAATAIAARRRGVPYALDLEDFHTGEQAEEPSSQLTHGLAERIEREVLPNAAFLTAASSAISEAYKEKYGLRPITVNNTFSLPRTAPNLAPKLDDLLRLYWFSQTIGPARGLEEAIVAMGLANITGELHLRGRAVPGYLENLRRLSAQKAPLLNIVSHSPTSPDTMIEGCRGFDIGLALEQGEPFNRDVCLTNKAFTYMLAGLAIAFTDTAGQRPLARDLGEGALLYKIGDVNTLAAGLRRWALDKQLLANAKAAAWEAAKRRWHWEHIEERGALLNAVSAVLN